MYEAEAVVYEDEAVGSDSYRRPLDNRKWWRWCRQVTWWPDSYMRLRLSYTRMRLSCLTPMRGCRTTHEEVLALAAWRPRRSPHSRCEEREERHEKEREEREEKERERGERERERERGEKERVSIRLTPRELAIVSANECLREAGPPKAGRA